MVRRRSSTRVRSATTAVSSTIGTQAQMGNPEPGTTLDVALGAGVTLRWRTDAAWVACLTWFRVPIG
jgi:hypothetical protein